MTTPTSLAGPAARGRGIVVVSFTGDSGIADYAVSLARRLALLELTTLVTSNRLPATYSGFGFEVVHMFRRTRCYPVDILRFLGWCLVRRPQAVNLQSILKVPLVEGLVVTVLRAAGVRCVLTVHDVLPHYPRAWSRAEYAWFYRRFDGLVVHSEAARVAVARMAPGVATRVVPHGVYDLFALDPPPRAEACRRIGWPDDEAAQVQLLFFGHLEPRKGLAIVLALAERLQDEAGLRFVLAGAFERARCPPALRTAVERARALPNVRLHDTRVPFERVQDYFSAADLVLMPYLEGSTSGVLKLALAFGVPVVATRVGDLAEQLPPGSGVLVEPGPDLEPRFLVALHDAIARRELLRAGMRAAAGTASWSGIAEDYSRFLLSP